MKLKKSHNCIYVCVHINIHKDYVFPKKIYELYDTILL